MLLEGCCAEKITGLCSWLFVVGLRLVFSLRSCQPVFPYGFKRCLNVGWGKLSALRRTWEGDALEIIQSAAVASLKKVPGIGVPKESKPGFPGFVFFVSNCRRTKAVFSLL